MYFFNPWPKSYLGKRYSEGILRYIDITNINWASINCIDNSPDSTPGALRLLWHKACAAETWGTAGSGNGGHITQVTIWWSGRDVIAASILIFVAIILQVKNNRSVSFIISFQKRHRHGEANDHTHNKKKKCNCDN